MFMVMDGLNIICHICYKHFPYRSNLERHMSVHSKERIYKCSYCDKSFKVKYALNMHENIHNNEKFICDICQKEFNTKDNLDTHKLVHSKEKLYICRHCDKSFSSKGNFKRHENTHTNTKDVYFDIYESFPRRELLDSNKSVPSVERLCTYPECKQSLCNQHMQLHTEPESVIYENCEDSCNNLSNLKNLIVSRSEEKNINSVNSKLNPQSPDQIISHSGTYSNPLNIQENIIQMAKAIPSNNEQMFLQNIRDCEKTKSSASSSIQAETSNTSRTEATNSIGNMTSCVVNSLSLEETKKGISQTCESAHQNILPLKISSNRPEMLNANDLNFMDETDPRNCNENSTKVNDVQSVDPQPQERKETFSRKLCDFQSPSKSDMPEDPNVYDVIIQSFPIETEWEELFK